MPSTCTHAACTDATLHMHILTHHPPHVNKLERLPQAKTSEQNASHMLTSIIMLYSVAHSCHQLLSIVLSRAWGLGSRQQRKEEEEQLGYARRSDRLPSPLICCFNPSLIPRSEFLTPRRLCLASTAASRSWNSLQRPSEPIRRDESLRQSRPATSQAERRDYQESGEKGKQANKQI